MSIVDTDTITLGMQTSREDDRTSSHVLALRKLLASRCKGPYAKEIKEFALILRIGGEMMEFDFKGCEGIKVNKKNQYITVDLGFPSYEWKGKSDSHIRAFLAGAVLEGLHCCIEHLEKRGAAVDGGRILSDFESVRQEYLA